MPTERTTDDPADNAGDNPQGRDNQPTEATAQAGAEEPGSQEEKVQQVKHSDFKRIKDEARVKGRREALTELDQAAVAAGFTSYADALNALAELKKSPP